MIGRVRENLSMFGLSESTLEMRSIYAIGKGLFIPSSLVSADIMSANAITQRVDARHPSTRQQRSLGASMALM